MLKLSDAGVEDGRREREEKLCVVRIEVVLDTIPDLAAGTCWDHLL